MTESEMFEHSDSTCSLGKLDTNYNSKHLQNIDCKLEMIIECISEYEHRRIADDNVTFMQQEWHAAAKVYDRFFFVLFILAMTFITVKFLVPTPDEHVHV